MFGTLESTWDQSTRRRWTALASFTAQAVALTLLLAISLIWVGPPQVRWLQLSAPASFVPQPAPATEERGHHLSASVGRPRQIFAPQTISPQLPSVRDETAGTISDFSAPDLPGSAVGLGNGGGSRIGAFDSIGNVAVALPSRPAPVAVKPLLVSHLSEANLLHKVQPVYPPLARQARVQGAVELRAIIGKTGAIENLVVVRGHPMLAAAAVEAVKQWRYRPYLLNNEPIEVETDITVNFLLSGG
jgi:protein TonB